MSKRRQARSQQSTQQTRRNEASTSRMNYCEDEGSDEDDSGHELEEAINRFVRYVVLRAGSEEPFRGKEIKKNVGIGGLRMDLVVEKTNKVLRSGYGYTLDLCESSTSTKVYAVRNVKPYTGDPLPTEQPLSDANDILTMLVLAHIFMSNNSCSFVSLSGFLKSLKVDVEKNHEIFGNVLHHINGTMAKQKLLTVEKMAQTDTRTYKWGSKAECTVSKMEVLKFVAQMYNVRLNTWPAKLLEAQQQRFEPTNAEEE